MCLWSSFIIVPEFATFSSPWAVTRPRQSANSVLTKLWSLLLLCSWSTIQISPKIVLVPSPSSPNGSPRIVVEVFITGPIDWQEIVGGGWFGHPSVLAISYLVGYLLLPGSQGLSHGNRFWLCPQGKKGMEAWEIVTKKVIPVAQASSRSQQLLLLISYHQKIDAPLLLQYFAQICGRNSDSLPCSVSYAKTCFCVSLYKHPQTIHISITKASSV